VSHRPSLSINISRSFSTSFNPFGPIKLHTEYLPASGGDAGRPDDASAAARPYSILFLHGLLGNGRNLKTFARHVVGKRQQRDPFCHGGILMDLRGHGKSYTASDSTGDWQQRSFTFQQCVQDVDYTLQELQQQQQLATKEAENDTLAPSTTVVVGHSWGGRLALEYAAAASTSKSPLQSLWLLDTVPGQAHESVDRVIAAVAEIVKEGTPVDRKDLVKTLTKRHGLDLGLAQWLASSYNPKTGDFGFDLDLVQNLKPEFANQDFVGLLRMILDQSATQIHLVRGGKNSAWSVPILAELENLAHQFPKAFHLHVLPSAGHWVHVDDLSGLVTLFDKHS
jgi:esterase